MYNQSINNLDVLVLEINPNNDIALAGKGLILASYQNDYGQALPYLNKALEVNPNNQAALRIKAAIFQTQGNYDQALPYLDKLLDINPNDELTLFAKV